MRKQMKTRLFIRSSLAMAIALAIWTPVQAQQVETEQEKVMMEDKMLERCREMTEQRQKMMAEMKAQDAELTAKVAVMNSAPEDTKLDLIADVVTIMVEQRTAMHAGMEKMQGKMMQHMMQHMQMGKESMSQCPMMRDMQMKGMDEKMKDAYKQNQKGKQ